MDSINQDLLDEYAGNIIVEAKNEMEAIKKIFHYDRESAVYDTFSLNELPPQEANVFLKSTDWQGVLDIEKENQFFKRLGNGLYTDEQVGITVNNAKYSVNQKLQETVAHNQIQQELKQYADNHVEIKQDVKQIKTQSMNIN